MKSLKEIKHIVYEDLEAFEKEFKTAMKTQVSLLNHITKYMTRSKGKQMRPLFTFLIAGMIGQKPREATMTGALMVELLHTATLVHDDIVDDAEKRRGKFTINALWKNKAAVLVGDFLLSRGLLVSLEKKRFDLLTIVAEATKEMSEGELLQIEKARHLDITEEVYFEIIRKKTASLIASCCAVGAASVDADPKTIDTMWRFGELLGMAFQIKDDLFDYQSSNKTGKPTGIDIKEKKMTLPLIYLLQNSSWLQRKKYIRIVKYHNENQQKVASLIKEVKQAGGLEYAKQKMNDYYDEAMSILSGFPANEYRQSLEDLMKYTISRDK
jgi:octaprenyl-diphosphate synthase